MSAHSPGPWRVVEPDPSDDDDHETWIVDHRGKRIASVIDDDDGLGAAGRPRANISLIAAAPRMLELLRSLGNEWTNDDLAALDEAFARFDAERVALLAEVDG